MRTKSSKQRGDAKSIVRSFSGSGNQLIPIIYQNENMLVDARLLHKKLEVGRDFSTWVKDRIEQYGFEEGIDFSPNLGKSTGGRKAKEYHLTLDMAKELAMIENNDTGRTIRRYFIQAEKLNRTQVLQADAEGLFKGMQPVMYRGYKCYPYVNVLKAVGFSATSGAVQSRKKRFPGQFFKLFGRNFITSQFAHFLVESRKHVQAAQKMQMQLPFLEGGATC